MIKLEYKGVVLFIFSFEKDVKGNFIKFLLFYFFSKELVKLVELVILLCCFLLLMGKLGCGKIKLVEVVVYEIYGFDYD